MWRVIGIIFLLLLTMLGIRYLLFTMLRIIGVRFLLLLTMLGIRYLLFTMLRIIGVRFLLFTLSWFYLFFFSNILLDKSKIAGHAIGECLTFRHYKESDSIQPQSCSDRKKFILCQDAKSGK